MKIYLYFLVILFLVLPSLVACSAKSATEKNKFFSTENEAKEHGESFEGAKILTIIKYQGEQIVLISKPTNLVAVASVLKEDKGFVWYRSAPYVNFENKVFLNYETKSGKTIPMVIGKVNRDSKRVRIGYGNINTELPVYDGYFIGLGITYNHNFEVTVIE